MSESITVEVSDRICKHMNDDHADAILLYAKTFGAYPSATAAQMNSIDPEGMNLAAQVNGSSVPVRINFDHLLVDAEDAHQTLIAMVKTARQQAPKG